MSAPWRTDAEWSEGGALCIDNLRWDIDGETTEYVDSRCPERWSTSFACFSSASTFHAVNGYATPLAHRSLIRNEFNQSSVSP